MILISTPTKALQMPLFLRLNNKIIPKMKKQLILFLTILTVLSACKKDEEQEFAKPKFYFTFNWDGTPVTLSDFNDIKYTNQNQDELSITRMRYLISNITFNVAGLESYSIDGYNLVDLTNQSGLTYEPSVDIPTKDYTSISFTFGFDEIDNAEVYTDLNTASWNWPAMLGGGYHFMQYEGKFINSLDEEQGYAYHMGTAKVSDGVFEPNHFTVVIDGFNLETDANIEIKMNIAEWFKNPYTWDLNVFNQPLMPNYEAQKKMNLNGHSVFSLGSVN